MTSLANSHLSDKQLLFYVDGELASRESVRVRKHLEACWACRAKLEDLQGAIKKIVEFHDQVLLPMVPPPPRHWDGLEPRMKELDDRLERRSILDRLSGLFRSSFLEPRYAVFAVLVLAALGAWVWFPAQPIISATELLARVQAAQSAALGKVTTPVMHQRLRVRRKVAGSTEQASADYDAWEDQSRGRFRQAESSAEVLAELRTICDANHLDWQAPLSAAGFARWRNSLSSKQDFVAPESASTPTGLNDGPEPLALTTVAGRQVEAGSAVQKVEGNRIVKAELVVRSADWHPVQERLWVDDREYEIAELDYRVLPLAEVEASVFAEPVAAVKPLEARRPVLTKVEETVTLPPPDPNETEMAVRYGLHQLEADLGEPIEISRNRQGKVIVEAAGVALDLQARLRQQLAAIPNTDLELDATSRATCEACPVPLSTLPETDTRTPAPTLSIVPAVNPNEKRLEEIFGDPHAQESFTREVLGASSDALSRGFALRDLAVRYPPEEEARLTPQAKAQLKEMVDDHVAGLAEPTHLLQGLLRPLLEALSDGHLPSAVTPQVAACGPDSPLPDCSGGLRPPTSGQRPPLQPGSSWQSASLEIFAAVQKVERMIKGLLTRTDTAIPANQVVPELREALSEQQQALNQYGRVQ